MLTGRLCITATMADLGWLEYNIKRALMLECDNEEEQQLGISEVKETVEHIIYCDKVKDEILKKITDY